MSTTTTSCAIPSKAARHSAPFPVDSSISARQRLTIRDKIRQVLIYCPHGKFVNVIYKDIINLDVQNGVSCEYGKNWRNSIRHTLSYKDEFNKHQVAGQRASVWSYDPNPKYPKKKRATTKRHTSKRRAIGRLLEKILWWNTKVFRLSSHATEELSPTRLYHSLASLPA